MHGRAAAMRIELLPLLLGIVVVLIGGAFAADAIIPDGTLVPTERRRRARPERSRWGEALVGAGIIAAGGALIGRDTWRYSTLAVLAAAVLMAAGLVANRKYIRGVLLGPALGPRMRRRSSDRGDAPED